MNTRYKGKLTKQELLEIYNKAKKGNYDLTKLNIEDIEIFNELIAAEIQIKTKKIQEILTYINNS